MIANSNAIARFIARMRADGSLLGACFRDQCKIDSLMDFITHELEVPCALLCWNAKGLVQAEEGHVQKALEDVAVAVAEMEKKLNGGKKFLVGEEVPS